MLVIEIPKTELELIDKVCSLNCEITTIKNKNFTADANIVTLIVAVTPCVLDALVSIITLLTEKNKNVKIKCDNIEISGLDKADILELLDELAKRKENNT